MADILTEILELRQIPNEPRRRWFRSDDLDLIVWFDESGVPTGFQLCYDRTRAERALTWRAGFGFLHTGVDDGEQAGLWYKEAPILVGDGELDANGLSDHFLAASAGLPPGIAGFVGNKLKEHPSYRIASWSRP